MGNDPESHRFAMNFVVSFVKAKRFVSLRLQGYDNIVFGIRVPEMDGGSAQASEVLRDALKQAGIEFDSGPPPPPIQWTGRSYGIPEGAPFAVMYIGPKPPPDDQPWLA